ncbi:MAG: hypothetical protein RXO36_06880 [Candidatus Nanopusillus acidilobi]
MNKKILQIIPIFLILFISIKANALTITCNQSLIEVENSYNYLAKASSLGYNSDYIINLKESINYLNIGINYNNETSCMNSYIISKNISLNGQKILNEAETHYYIKLIENIFIIIVFLVFSYLSYKYLTSIYWWLWLKTHENYEVKKND